MATPEPSKAERTLRRIAASDRKQGYRVAAKPASEALPTFLSNGHPDRIAERDDDRVVVEIKPAGSLRGANDVGEMAELVATQPGWRLELITSKDKDPDDGVLSEAWLEQILTPTEDALACVYRLQVLAFLLRGLALRFDVRIQDRQPVSIAEELAFAGVIDGALTQRISDAFRWQSNLIRGHAPSPSAVAQAAELERLCHALFARVQTPEVQTPED
jgi:hypothetical protein